MTSFDDYAHLWRLLEDTNGELKYASSQAAFGYVTEGERLMMPIFAKDLTVRDHKVELKRDQVASKEVSSAILTLNFNSLKDAGYEEGVAMFCAVMRLKLITAGCLITEVKDRCVRVDEVVWVDYKANAAEEKKVLAKLSPDLIKAVSLGYKAWIGMLVTVFTSRGHHWKPDLQQRYDALWRACTIDLNYPLISWQHITRTSIHPFGIARLAYLFEHWCDTNEVPSALVIRRTAMPAGRAYLGVIRATLAQMSSHNWYVEFQKRYAVQITKVQQTLELVERDRYVHHFYADIFGKDAKEAKNSDVLNDVMALVPFVQAYIKVMATNTPLQNQKSIEKVARNMSGKMAEFERVLSAWERDTSNIKDVVQYLQAV